MQVLCRMEAVKVYGPYLDSRKTHRIVVVVHDDGTRKTHSAARWWWLQNRGPVPDGMEVDHINGNGLDDRPENYQLLARAENTRKAVRQLGRAAQIGSFTCPGCQATFERDLRVVRSNNGTQGKSGPYCSKSCAGRWSRRPSVKPS